MSLLWSDPERSGRPSLWAAVVVLGILAGLALAGRQGLLGRDVWERVTGSYTRADRPELGMVDY